MFNIKFYFENIPAAEAAARVNDLQFASSAWVNKIKKRCQMILMTPKCQRNWTTKFLVKTCAACGQQKVI